MKRRIFAFLIVAALIIMMLPAGALAYIHPPKIEIYVAGTDVVNGRPNTTHWLNDGAGGITSTNASASYYNVMFEYNGGNYTLTLKNASLSENYTEISDFEAVIYSNADLTIELIENNQINQSCEDVTGCGGIYVDNREKLTIQGKGSLKVKSGSASAMTAGIYADDDITITGGCTIDALGGNALGEGGTGGIMRGESYGICSYTGKVTLQNSIIGTGGGEVTSTNLGKSVGIWGHDGVEIDGSEVYAYSDKTNGSESISRGIGTNIGSGITILGGTVTAISTGGTGTAQAMTVAPDLTKYVGEYSIQAGEDESSLGDYDAADYDSYKCIKIGSPTPTSPAPVTTQSARTYTHADWLRDNQYDAMAPPSGLEPDVPAPAEQLFGDPTGSAATASGAPAATPTDSAAPLTPTDVASATNVPAVLPPQTADAAPSVFLAVILLLLGANLLALLRRN